MAKKKLMTKDEAVALIKEMGWKISSNRKERRDEDCECRWIFVEKEFPYEESKNRKMEYTCERTLERALKLSRYDVCDAEWTNEDGGPLNKVRMSFYIHVAL